MKTLKQGKTSIVCSIEKLTLEEKLKLLTGERDSWGTYTANGKLKQLMLIDGPNGVRKETKQGSQRITQKATAMPVVAVLANTWSREAAYLEGQTIADDCIEQGVDILLAPGVNIKRTPLCGRNFEYFSEDPYLSGELAKEYIQGVQTKGIGVSLKHYCANNREADRMYQSSEVDERTLREIYLPAFEKALEAEPWTVMCSYNPINGVYASENKYLLDDVLRKEFGFNGMVMSDWDAVHNEPRRIRAGCDLRMPYDCDSYADLKNAYEAGEITEQEIDVCVTRILELIEKSQNERKRISTTPAERHANAVKIAEEGIVLLKNEGNLLPLKSGKTLIAGEFAVKSPLGGGGSSLVNTGFVQQDLATLLRDRLDSKAEISYCRRTHIYPNSVNWGFEATYREAYDNDNVILCVGNDARIEAEGYDRVGLKLTPDQEAFIKNTAKVNKNVIVVVYAGSAIDMSAWIDDVKAVIFAGFLGEAANEALANVLTGKVVPSGKLAETFPLNVNDTPMGTETGNGFTEWYKEGIFVGYRYYDSNRKDVLFPFGYGLSYADFTYDDLKIRKISETDYEISYNITNNSDFAAKEISQVYVKDVFSMVLRPEKELKGFSKDEIGPHETKRVSVVLDARSFAYYNVSLKRWHVENGAFEILVGSSSRDIRLSARIDICLPEKTQQTVSWQMR